MSTDFARQDWDAVCLRLLGELLMKSVKPQDTIEDLKMDSLEIVEWQYMIEEAFKIVIPDAAFDDISDAFTIEHVIEILHREVGK